MEVEEKEKENTLYKQHIRRVKCVLYNYMYIIVQVQEQQGKKRTQTVQKPGTVHVMVEPDKQQSLDSAVSS